MNSHVRCSGPRFNIKITSYQFRKSHCGDKTVVSTLNNQYQCLHATKAMIAINEWSLFQISISRFINKESIFHKIICDNLRAQWISGNSHHTWGGIQTSMYFIYIFNWSSSHQHHLDVNHSLHMLGLGFLSSPQSQRYKIIFGSLDPQEEYNRFLNKIKVHGQVCMHLYVKGRVQLIKRTK